jgi:hypothetical protein
MIVPNVGDRLTYTIHSVTVPEKVPQEAVTHKLNKDRVFEIELLSQAEMRDLRNRFRLSVRRRGVVGASKSEISGVFDEVMKSVAGQIETEFEKVGVGHVIGEDRHFGDGRDSEEWFYVLRWPEGNKIRGRLGFEEKDFHMTLGMTGNGVDEYAKDKSTLLDDEDLSKLEGGMTKLFVDE